MDLWIPVIEPTCSIIYVYPAKDAPAKSPKAIATFLERDNEDDDDLGSLAVAVLRALMAIGLHLFAIGALRRGILLVLLVLASAEHVLSNFAEDIIREDETLESMVSRDRLLIKVDR